MDSSSGSVPSNPAYNNYNFPNAPITNNLLRGVGQLTWLSPKAGLINCSQPTPVTVSFQLKDFCDSAVVDLTSVLRVGFRLSFHAVSANDSNNYIANYVSPISDTDLASGLNDNKELDLEAVEKTLSSGSTRQVHKDPYSLEMESQSLSFLLSIFHKNAVHFMPLSSLHSRISNSGKEDLYRYIGSSSLKRRQFIERRSYIFYFGENDVVFLQPSEIYTTVCLLTGFLLSHGGVTSSDALFSFFHNNSAIPLVVKETIKKNRQNFMNFLANHPFAFAPFPSQFYVSVRRNLPYFDYNGFIKKFFPACVYPRNTGIPSFIPARPLTSPFNNFELPDSGNSTFHTPSTPMTPLFQEDPLMMAQNAANRMSGTNMSSIWQNDIGFFDHPHSFNGNNGVGLVSGRLSSHGPPNIPPIGTTAIVGRGSSDIIKPELMKRPTELDLVDLSMLKSANSARKYFTDAATQTDIFLPENNRGIGGEKCCCKCTCGVNNSLNDKDKQPISFLENGFHSSSKFASNHVGTSSSKFDLESRMLSSATDHVQHSFFTPFSIGTSIFPLKPNPFMNGLCGSDPFPAGEHNGRSNSTASSTSSSNVVGQHKGLPMPIGGGASESLDSNSSSTTNVDSNVEHNNANNTVSGSTSNASVSSASQERLFDPFAKVLPFELSLKF